MKGLIFSLMLLLGNQNRASAGFSDLANKTYRKHHNTITVQIIRSSYPLDWTSSRNLLISILKNRYWFPKTNSTLGHVTVEANCSLGENQVRIFSGQGVKNLMNFKEKVLAGYGLSLVNSPKDYSDLPLVTVEGKLNTIDEMRAKFDLQMERDNLSLLSFQVEQESCLNAYLFIREYIRKTDQTPLAGNKYGFGADPLKFEGAGCAPFVQAVLKKAGLDKVAMAMNQTLQVPSELLGDPKNGKIVSLFDLLSTNFTLDGNGPGETRSFSFPDPERLYQFLLESYTSNIVLEKQSLEGDDSYYLLLNFRKPVLENVDSDPSV